MFWGKKRKAVNLAVSGIQPLLRTLEMTGDGLPKGFWSDPYVLGYLTGCIFTFATMATKGRLAGNEMGQVVMHVYANLAPQHRDAIADAVIAFQQQGHPDYQLGQTNADKCLTVAYGVPGYEDDPDVLKAKAMAEQLSPALTSVLGPSTPVAQMGGMLTKMLFYDVVRERSGDHEEGEEPANAPSTRRSSPHPDVDGGPIPGLADQPWYQKPHR